MGAVGSGLGDASVFRRAFGSGTELRRQIGRAGSADCGAARRATAVQRAEGLVYCEESDVAQYTCRVEDGRAHRRCGHG
eukprot:3129414-Pyramimonas_sp.AAC.1